MYQSIFYSRTTKQCYLKDDLNGWSTFKYTPQVYRRINKYQEGALSILTGGYCIPISKNKRWDYNDPDILEKDINPELAILRDLYYNNDEDIPQNHSVVFLDIETVMGGALSVDYIKRAPMPLTSLALIDKTTQQKICFIIDGAIREEDKIQEINKDGKHIIPCDNEEDLIYKFLDKWAELDPTIVIGWNSQYFDIPYLYFRMCNVVGEKQAQRLSPHIGEVVVSTWNPTVNDVRIAGVNHLDYYLLHKKYIMKEEPSYKLNDIGIKYADLGKIEYEGNLNQLFKNDLNTFIEYNLRDVEILEALEDKLKFIELTILISHICNIPYEQIYYSTTLGEGAILKYLKRLNIVSPNKPITHNPSRKGKEETYAGGYLLEPEVGLYKDVIDLDFTSLYPSIIKSLNLGIETLVGRIFTTSNYEQELTLEHLKQKEPTEQIRIERLNKENYTLQSSYVEVKNLINIIEQNNYTISASGAIFDTKERSAASTVLEYWFYKREYYRELKKQAGKAKDWSKYKLYDLYQLAFKILQNAHYGTYAKNMFRYTDGFMICSSAITNCGQTLTKQTVKFVDNKLNKEQNTNKKYVIISDTDSAYIALNSILDVNLKGKERNNKILEIANNIQTDANLNLNTLCKSLFNIDSRFHYFQLKQEVIATSVLTTGKRRYGMYVTNKEGVEVEETVLMGLELMKSNMNKLFKEFGTNFIKQLLFDTPKSELDKSVVSFYQSLKTIDPRLLGKPTGVSYIDKFIKRKATTGEIFSELHLGAVANSKAAIRYNDLIKFKRLDKQYESIIEGDKIFIINLKENPYHIDTIGIPNSKIPPFIEDIINEFIDIETIFNSMIGDKLKELYSDLNMEWVNLNPKISKFFSFN